MFINCIVLAVCSHNGFDNNNNNNNHKKNNLTARVKIFASTMIGVIIKGFYGVVVAFRRLF